MLYEVIVKCGHVGKRNYILKTVPVCAEDKAQAAAKARMMPRVKHDHPDAIRQVRVVDAPRFAELVAVHRADPYFQCHCIQEQRALCHDLELLPEKRSDRSFAGKNEPSKKALYAGKVSIRNPKRYQRFYGKSEDDAA